MGSAGAIVAQILGILGRFDPSQCFRISSFRNFGEIRAWQHFSNLGCENIDKERLSPRFLKPEMQKVMEEQCTMYYSNMFVAFFSLLRDIGSSQQISL